MKWIDSILRRLNTPCPNRKSRRALAQRLSLTCLEDRVTPATITWDGGGGDSNWTTAANWAGDVAPTAGDDLVFADLGTYTALNDFVATTFASVTIEGANTTLAGNDIDLAGDITTSYTSGSSNVTGNVILGGGDVIVASGGALDFGGAISGSAGLTVSGGGTLRLSGSGSNTYTGTTLLAAGTLELNKTSGVAVAGNLTVGDGDGGELVRLLAADQIADGASVAVGEGATFDLNGASETVDALVVQGATVSIGTGGTLTLSSSLSSFDAGNNLTSLIQGGTLDLNGSGAFSVTVNDDPSNMIDLRIGSVVANGGISKAGAGILALAGTNTYAGATAVTAGAIQVESDAALGTAAGATTVSSGASVFFDGTNLSVAEGFTISGTGSAAAGALASRSGAATISGNVDLAANSQIGAVSSATLTVNGVIDDGAGTFNLTVAQGGTGRTVLGGANTFDGNLVVTLGYLRATHDNALGDPATASTASFANAASLELSGGIALPATKSLTLTLNGANNTDAKFINLAGNNTIQGAVLFAGNEEIDAATGTSLTISGAIGQSGGSRFLVKSGSGVLNLSGTNSYTGATFLAGGRLIVDGSISTSSSVTTLSGGTSIGGSGTVPAVNVSSGSTLAPGSSPGIINTGNLSLASGASLSAELNGTTVGTQYDQANVTGTVDVTGATLAVSVGFTPALGDTFIIIANDGVDAVTGTFSGLAEGATLSVGGQTFQISYVGGTGNDVTLTAFEAPTATVASSANPAVFGQPVTFSVTVAGSGATPTGNVSLVIDGSTIETVALAGGAAVFTAISALGVATHTVSVNYAGAGLYSASSGTLNGGQVVSQASTTSTVVSSDLTTVFGEAVTFTATIAAVAPGAGTPTGTVLFFDGATLLGTGAVAAGAATLTTSALSVASHSIAAVYSGDTNYAGSTSAPVTQVVSQASTTSTVASSDLTTVFGEAVTFTATIAAVAPGAGTPTGTVLFFDGATLLGTGAVSAGAATLTTSALSGGSHAVTAVYGGDANYAGSTSAPVTQVVAAGGTTTTLATSDSESDLRATVTFTATVTSTAPGTPTGTVTFSADGTVLATVTVNGTGGASFSTAALASGTHTITASFTPADGNFLASVGTVTQTVLPPSGNDVNADGRADIIVGTATASSHIKVFSGTDGSLLRSFLAFDGFQGGVASAGGDTNGDGFTDVIAGASTTSSHVKVFDGATGALLRSFLAFDGSRGGVVVASGDVDGDGFADVIVGTRTGGSHVKVFSGADGSTIRSFLAFDGYTGGVSVAGGDVDGDGFADVIVGAAGGSSHVKVFSGRDGSLLQSYFAFPGYLGGVTVAAGDLNGDGRVDVVVGAATGSSHVKVFSGLDQSELRSFLALPGFTGNLSVAVADVNGDGTLDIVASSRTGTSSVTSVDGTSLDATSSFLAFGGFLGGVEVG